MHDSVCTLGISPKVAESLRNQLGFLSSLDFLNQRTSPPLCLLLRMLYRMWLLPLRGRLPPQPLPLCRCRLPICWRRCSELRRRSATSFFRLGSHRSWKLVENWPPPERRESSRMTIHGALDPISLAATKRRLIT